MRFERLAKGVARHRTTVVLLALLSTFAGTALLLDRPKGSELEWLGLPFLALGAAVFISAVWPRSDVPLPPSPNLAFRLLRWLTWQGRLVRLFPALGIGLVLIDLLYNLVLSATPAIQTEDTIVLLFAFTLVIYGFVPVRFQKERDFVLVFFVTLNAILVAPLLLARLYYSDFERSVDLYSWVALAPQTSGVLLLLGVTNSVHAVGPSSAPGLTFTPQHFQFPVTVVITTACSGIYSFGIFAAAFVSFILTEFAHMSRRMWILLGLGFVTSYVANVFRMVAIVLVGYYTDTPQTDLQNMLVAHSYAGWLIFLAWIALFWTGLLKWVPRDNQNHESFETRPTPSKSSHCKLCQNVLSPVVAATRCTCGEFCHSTCLVAAGSCPSCGRKTEPVPTTFSEVR